MDCKEISTSTSSSVDPAAKASSSSSVEPSPSSSLAPVPKTLFSILSSQGVDLSKSAPTWARKTRFRSKLGVECSERVNGTVHGIDGLCFDAWTEPSENRFLVVLTAEGDYDPVTWRGAFVDAQSDGFESLCEIFTRGHLELLINRKIGQLKIIAVPGGDYWTFYRCDGFLDMPAQIPISSKATMVDFKDMIDHKSKS